MPVVEDLLPAPHNDIVLDMLFSLAEFHAFAKMRLHTERTLELFEQSIKTLGDATRKFETVTCAAYDTKELPRETAARDRREAAAAAKAAGKQTPQAASGRTKGKGKAKPAAVPKGTKRATGSSRHVKFQLSTIKYHSFGDYPDAIRAFGTLDVSSTQQVSQQYGTRSMLLTLTCTGRARASLPQEVLSSHQQEELYHTDREAAASRSNTSEDQKKISSRARHSRTRRLSSSSKPSCSTSPIARR